jgi:hypothetical protein
MGSYSPKDSPFDGFYFNIRFLLGKNRFNGLFNEPFFFTFEEVI